MRIAFMVLLMSASCLLVNAQGESEAQSPSGRIESMIDSSSGDEIVLIQEFTVNVGIDSVWNAYTTRQGWESWAVPIAEVDLKVGGYIKTNYNKDGEIGDSSTIMLHIINYVPQKILTLQAEITDNFPEFMKAEAEDFYNIIYFRSLRENQTLVESYGIGYKNNPKYLSLLGYFVKANEMSSMNLIKYLETGVSPGG